MPKSKKPADKILEFSVPQQAIETQIEDWIRRVLESNTALVAALERIRESYCAQLAVHPIQGADEVLAEVEAAITMADKAKNVV